MVKLNLQRSSQTEKAEDRADSASLKCQMIPEGQNAISGLNETNFEGKTISVNVARPKTDRSSGGYNNRGGNDGYNRNRY